MLISTRYDSENNLLLARLSGDLDAQSAPRFVAEMQQILEKYSTSIILSCEGLDFIDSVGLGTLVKLLKLFEVQGLSLELKKMKPRIYKLCVITGLDDSFKIEVDK